MYNICYNKVEKSRKRARIAMNTCDLTITTAVDGQESKISRTGKIDYTDGTTVLEYHEENAQVRILLKDGRAEIDRRGDYSLKLLLEEGKRTQGNIGVGGSEGQIGIHASRVQYAETEGVLRIFLQYTLLFGAETQRMKLHICAKIKY